MRVAGRRYGDPHFSQLSLSYISIHALLRATSGLDLWRFQFKLKIKIKKCPTKQCQSCPESHTDLLSPDETQAKGEKYLCQQIYLHKKEKAKYP
jgi:hypothetical protein